jgi:hypothetical protein
MSPRDEADKLALLVHGREAKSRDLVGGSNARLFTEAAARIEEGQRRIAELEDERDAAEARSVQNMLDGAALAAALDEAEKRGAERVLAQLSPDLADEIRAALKDIP